MRHWALAMVAVTFFGCGDDDGTGVNNNGNQQQGVCGNSIVDPGEECDDGPENSDVSPGACRTTCLLAFCGDSVLDASEMCDSGLQNGVSPNPCRADCQPNTCGDGYLGGSEVCDDGNTTSGDGCRGDCGQDETLCGNGVVDPGEGCDDAGGNSDTTPDACRTDCQPARCGDAVIDSGENCDDGNTIDDLTCSADCENYCGDGVRNPTLGEACDRGADNGESPSDCLAGCVLTTCGDGHLGGPEEGCDDGNTSDGDGCSALCQVESRWACTGSPSVCGCAEHNYGSGCAGCVVFVSLDGTSPTRDGQSWGTAFAEVQQGLDAAHADGPGCEVWVARGTYHIYAGSETDTVTLHDGVGVYGGFAGHETERGARDPASQVTVLDGRAADDAERRVFHVVTAWGTKDATLDGFTITAGRAYGLETSIDDRGGGLLAYSASVAVLGCTFYENTAGGDGGGLYIHGGSGSLVNDSTFRGNSAARNGGGMYVVYGESVVTNCSFSDNSAVSGGGGGLYNGIDSSPTVTNCAFSGNAARGGGGMYSDGSSPTVSGCTFTGNTAVDFGGGMHNYSSSPTVSGCIFAGNAAVNAGGGMYNRRTMSSVTRCTFFRNSANWGGGMYNMSDIWVQPSTVSGCIFTGNTAVSAGGGMANGGMHVQTITDCTLSGNSAGSGGGMHNIGCHMVTGCTFSGNSANSGGGMYNNWPSPAVTNSTFAGNTAQNGAGMYNWWGDPTVTNSTFSGNSTGSEGGGMNNYNASPTVVNCIVWGNTAGASGPSIFDDGGSPQVVYSVIQGGYTGSGTMIRDLDPGFVSPPLDTGPWGAVIFDATLLMTALHDADASWVPDALVGLYVQPDSTDPRWLVIAANTTNTIFVHGDASDLAPVGASYALHDLHLDAASLCIDAGYGCATPGGCDIPPLVPETPPFDLEGSSRHSAAAQNGGVGTPDYVDLGAYEWHP